MGFRRYNEGGLIARIVIKYLSFCMIMALQRRKDPTLCQCGLSRIALFREKLLHAYVLDMASVLYQTGTEYVNNSGRSTCDLLCLNEN